MTTYSKLCHRANDAGQGAGKLCYKDILSRPLVRKASAQSKDPDGRMEIMCTFEPLDWVCDTYNATHEGALVVTASWLDEPEVRVGAFVMAVDDEYTAGTATLTLDVSPQDMCAAHEYPATITGAVTVTKDDVTKTVEPFEWHPSSITDARRVTIELVDGELVDVTVDEIPAEVSE